MEAIRYNSWPLFGAFAETQLLRVLARRLAPARVAVALRDQDPAVEGFGVPVAIVRVKDNACLPGLLLDPDLHFGEAYVNGSLVVEGDLVEALTSVSRSAIIAGRLPSPPRVWERVLSNLVRTVKGRDFIADMTDHYDLSNDFYRLWLDPEMTYTCAYWASPDLDLKQAQIAKLDYVCRKLHLVKDETVIEAGCGWGSLAIYMAEHYGVRVRAFNVSGEQVAWARRRVKERGLGDRIEIVHDDALNASGPCDAFVSVGMLESIAPSRYRDFGRLIANSLSGNGRGLIHSIGRSAPYPTNRWIDRYIFPGGHTPSLRQILTCLEPNGLVVGDVENLRAHYVRTLRCWLDQYEKVSERVVTDFGESFQRRWRLYLAAALAGFESDWLELFQITFTCAGSGPRLSTRAHLYR